MIAINQIVTPVILLLLVFFVELGANSMDIEERSVEAPVEYFYRKFTGRFGQVRDATCRAYRLTFKESFIRKVLKSTNTRICFYDFCNETMYRNENEMMDLCSHFQGIQQRTTHESLTYTFLKEKSNFQHDWVINSFMTSPISKTVSMRKKKTSIDLKCDEKTNNQTIVEVCHYWKNEKAVLEGHIYEVFSFGKFYTYQEDVKVFKKKELPKYELEVIENNVLLTIPIEDCTQAEKHTPEDVFDCVKKVDERCSTTNIRACNESIKFSSGTEVDVYKTVHFVSTLETKIDYHFTGYGRKKSHELNSTHAILILPKNTTIVIGSRKLSGADFEVDGYSQPQGTDLQEQELPFMITPIRIESAIRMPTSKEIDFLNLKYKANLRILKVYKGAEAAIPVLVPILFCISLLSFFGTIVWAFHVCRIHKRSKKSMVDANFEMYIIKKQ